jgi:hypothetical protein
MSQRGCFAAAVDFLAARSRYGYICDRREAGGGAMPVLIVLLVLALAIGFVSGFLVGYSVRENISRRRRAAVRAAVEEERYRELDGDQTLPRLE